MKIEILHICSFLCFLTMGITIASIFHDVNPILIPAITKSNFPVPLLIVQISEIALLLSTIFVGSLPFIFDNIQ